MIRPTFFAVVMMLSGMGYAADIQIDVTGEVSDQTCTVKADKKNVVVKLPTVATSSLRSAGQVAGYMPFKIELTGCSRTFVPSTGSTHVLAFFTPADNQVHETHGTLLNTKATGAKNVTVQLTNEDRSPVKLQNRNNDNRFESYSGVKMIQGNTDYVLNYGARYYAVGVATAGEVQAFTTYTVEYK